MTLLLCPECCQWREPTEGRCSVCAGTLDLAIPDPSVESLGNEIGDLQELLGEAELSRIVQPKRGQLYATTNGLLFVPSESRVIVFAKQPSSLLASRTTSRKGEGNRTWFLQWVSRLKSRLNARAQTVPFDCEPRASELTAGNRLELAELLRSDPGVRFWSRASIATWRRLRGEWELIRPDRNSWPERIAMRHRDGDRALQHWLETTECPLPVNIH